MSVNERNNVNFQGVAVHCYWGRGRTGTMLAAYLVGMQGMDPDDAIRLIRQKRPYSIETYEQEEALHNYYTQLKQTLHDQEST